MSTDRFRDRVALVTGASSGIGAALARELVSQGASVALVARRVDRLAALAAELTTGAGPDRALALVADVTRDGEVERAVADTLARWGRLDVVVANAGFGVVGRVASLGLPDFRRQLETNFFGVLRTVYATLPALRQSRGTLALMGSVSGHVAAPGTAPYAVSKFAVRALAEVLRAELVSEGVTVVLVSPGFVASEIRQVDNQGVQHPRARDPVPGFLVMPTARAARRIVRAIARGRREAVITGHGRLLVGLARHWPGLLAWGMARARFQGRREPGPGAP